MLRCIKALVSLCLVQEPRARRRVVRQGGASTLIHLLLGMRMQALDQATYTIKAPALPTSDHSLHDRHTTPVRMFAVSFLAAITLQHLGEVGSDVRQVLAPDTFSDRDIISKRRGSGVDLLLRLRKESTNAKTTEAAARALVLLGVAPAQW